MQRVGDASRGCPSGLGTRRSLTTQTSCPLIAIVSDDFIEHSTQRRHDKAMAAAYHLSSDKRAISRAPLFVRLPVVLGQPPSRTSRLHHLPPINPVACTKMQPEIPISLSSTSSLSPLHDSGRLFRLSKVSALRGTAWMRQLFPASSG